MLLKGRKSFDVTYVVSVSLQASRRIAFRRQRPPRFVVRARMTRFNNFSSTSKRDPLLPSMIVFDLDDCLWTPEMHELPGIPEIPVHEIRNDHSVVVGLQIARFRDTVKLYEGARKVLYELATNPLYEGIELATASSSLEPSYSYACLGGLEILRGLFMGEMMR